MKKLIFFYGFDIFLRFMRLKMEIIEDEMDISLRFKTLREDYWLNLIFFYGFDTSLRFYDIFLRFMDIFLRFM
jgi:hypothetical protein